MDQTSRPARTQPKLVRSTSGTAPSVPITPEDRASRSQRFITANNNNNNNRSKSTSSRSRTLHSNSGATSPGMINKVPSAWALSPGRSSLGPRFVSKGSESPPVKANGGGGGRGVRSMVLNYLKQRKGSRIEEEEGYHRFRVLHNRLLQWRFINAKAHSTVATTKTVSEMQLFSVWLRTLVIRNMVIQKRVEVQNVKHLIKLCQIVIPQLPFLNEWEKLERRNQESIGRLERKLLALSNTIPLTHDLKANTVSVHEALNTATEVMNHIEPLIMRFQTQAERILYQVTELIATSKQEEQYLQDLTEVVPIITNLMEKEKSIQVCLMQNMEANIRIDPSYT